MKWWWWSMMMTTARNINGAVMKVKKMKLKNYSEAIEEKLDNE